MAVVPSNAYLLTTNDLKHIKHFLLVDRVNCFDAYCCGELRHREDIDDLYSILIHKFAYHDAHYFKRHACSAVLQHLKQRKSRYLHLFGCIWYISEFRMALISEFKIRPTLLLAKTTIKHPLN
jgi:hypothetical protein